MPRRIRIKCCRLRRGEGTVSKQENQTQPRTLEETHTGALDPDQVVTAPIEDADEFFAEHIKPRYDSGHIIYILTPSEAAIGNEMTLEELASFLADCFAHFGEWALDYIDDYVESAGLEAASFSSQVKGALDGGDIADLATGQHQTINLTYEKYFNPFSNGDYGRTIHRETGVSYHIYSCHSFSSGSDYYLVQCDYSSKPDVHYDYIVRNTSDGEPAYYTEYFAGATSYIWANTYINEYGTNNRINLVKTVPFQTLQKNTNYSETMGWSLGGQISMGVNKDGSSMGAQISESVSHNETVSYSTTDWTLTNRRDQTGTTHATFGASVEGAKITALDHKIDRSGFHDDDYWDKVELIDAAKNELKFTTEFMWEVTKEFWQDIDVHFLGAAAFTDLFVHGGGHCYRIAHSDHSGSSETKKIATGVDAQEIAPYNLPPHTYVSTPTYQFGAVGGQGSFKLLCNSNWKIESDSDWVTIPQIYQSGSDTGGQATEISFNVAPYSSSETYDARRAIITVTEILPDGSNRVVPGDVLKIEVNQNSH